LGEELSIEALLEFLNAVEAGVASAKNLIAHKKNLTPHLDYDGLGWVTREGTKGAYEQCSRANSKIEVFDGLAAELKEHGGFWQHKGCRYWFHQNDENTIDRRKVQQ